ncbi:MAG: DNA-3-methyladenine glycosylase [Bacteroidales bacterium]|nr:DNA-3-methyladenine glycosylase [Bacteroidales bacterium]
MVHLPRKFYTRPDVVQIARELLGKQLITRMGGVITSGIICETEAYAGATDKASHAFGCRRTERTEIMYDRGGTAYIYLCYGVHSLFNVVTNIEGVPHAVLIRGIIPVEGIETMLQRAGKPEVTKNFGIGPGKVSKILGIHYTYSGLDLVKNPGKNNEPAIWIEDHGVEIPPSQIISGPRIGVDYAGEDAMLPYRFSLP